jgi:hypothetical protein
MNQGSSNETSKAYFLCNTLLVYKNVVPEDMSIVDLGTNGRRHYNTLHMTTSPICRLTRE